MELARPWRKLIDPGIASAPLWRKSDTPVEAILRAEMFISNITVASDVLVEIYRKAELQTLETGYLLGFSQAALQVSIEEVHWTEALPADLLIRLDPRRLLTHEDFNLAVGTSVSEIGNSTLNLLHPESYQYILYLGTYCWKVPITQLTIKLLYPNCAFETRPLKHMLKIVSSPLSQRLRKRRDRYETGFLTMDSEHRVLPLLANDPMVLVFPLVGVWVTEGMESDSKLLSASHLWSICTRFVTHPQIRHRVGVTPSTFLLLNFSSSVLFKEVTFLTVGAEWKEMTSILALSREVKENWEVKMKSSCANTSLLHGSGSCIGSGAVNNSSTGSTFSQSYEELEISHCEFAPELDELLLGDLEEDGSRD